MSDIDDSQRERRIDAEELLKSGDSAAAEKLLEKVVETTPKDARAWQLLGTARYENGHLRPAVVAFQERLRIEPESVVSTLSLAIVLRDLGEKEHARQLLTRVIERRPGWKPAMDTLATLDNPVPPKEAAAPATQQHQPTAGKPKFTTISLPEEEEFDDYVERSRQRARADFWTNAWYQYPIPVRIFLIVFFTGLFAFMGWVGYNLFMAAINPLPTFPVN